MKDANLIMQAGDIVAIEPFINWGAPIIVDIGQLASLLTTTLILYTLLK